MGKIKALYLNVKSGEFPRVIELDADGCNLDLFYELLDCDCIDIVLRPICGRKYYVICDDEYLLKPIDPVPALLFRGERNMSVYGNVILAVPGNPGTDRDFGSMTADDVLHVTKRLCYSSMGERTSYCIVV